MFSDLKPFLRWPLTQDMYACMVFASFTSDLLLVALYSFRSGNMHEKDHLTSLAIRHCHWVDQGKENFLVSTFWPIQVRSKPVQPLPRGLLTPTLSPLLKHEDMPFIAQIVVLSLGLQEKYNARVGSCCRYAVTTCFSSFSTQNCKNHKGRHQCRHHCHRQQGNLLKQYNNRTITPSDPQTHPL